MLRLTWERRHPSFAAKAQQVSCKTPGHQQTQSYPYPKKSQVPSKRDPSDGNKNARRSDEHRPHEVSGVVSPDEKSVGGEDDSVYGLEEREQNKDRDAENGDDFRASGE